MKYARDYFSMNTRHKDGQTARATFTKAAKLGNKLAQAELAKLAVTPGPLAYLWHDFLELHNRRGSGGMGPASITWPDIDAWARRRRRDPSQFALDVFDALDGVFFETAMPKAGG